MIKTLAILSLIVGGLAAAAAGLGASLDLAIGDGQVNGCLIVTLVSIPLGLLGATHCLRGRDRLISWLTLSLAVALCLLAIGWTVSSQETLTLVAADSRFWTLFDLVLYSVAALVLMNAGLLGRRGRGDDDD